MSLCILCFIASCEITEGMDSPAQIPDDAIKPLPGQPPINAGDARPGRPGVTLDATKPDQGLNITLARPGGMGLCGL